MTPDEIQAQVEAFQAKGGQITHLNWSGQPTAAPKEEPAAAPATPTLSATPPKSPAKAPPARPSLECKGSIALGSGCKRCLRCKAEQANLNRLDHQASYAQKPLADAPAATADAENGKADAENGRFDAEPVKPLTFADLIEGMKPHPAVVVDLDQGDQAGAGCHIAQELSDINDQVASIRQRLARLEEFTQ